MHTYEVRGLSLISKISDHSPIITKLQIDPITWESVAV
jgi:hypothetical protein